MKTNPLKSLALSFILLSAGRAGALEAFECVRDLIPVTEQAAFQGRRKDVEKPFMLTEKYMAFPEIKKDAVTGFYVYASGRAWYYDSVVLKDGQRKRPLADLNRTNRFSLYSLIAQPSDLETVILQFMPGFGNNETTHGGPVVLGSTLMPVVGALMSRTNEQLRVVYRNPAEVDEDDLKRWIREHSSRSPAMNGPVAIDKQLFHLTTSKEKSKKELWAPLLDELKVRKLWVQNHNLSEESFRRLSKVMETSCKNVPGT